MSPSRGAGWECVQVWSTTPPDWAYVEVLSDEKAPTAVGFLAATDTRPPQKPGNESLISRRQMSWRYVP